ncbi:activating signal cointegrator 1 complex subunit 1-like [Sycon ciliatum]|uniref:activating signal cointegrator 1 complex subunit 1-like n=1 Tax=Sycon ciliatum TaxID=27933 RepID=UPI0020A86D9A|eukprot:scpid82431/ scgid18780/ Activating signal cointegrator 1 complex subunit 1; ASC-1 complex subunit p50; Trip4 complex subunit p50
MDVLRPHIIDLGGRYYRCSPASVGQASDSDAGQLPAYVEDVHDEDYEDNEECIAIQELPDGRYSSSLTFPSALFSHFIGRGGDVKRRNEKETNTSIDIPKKGVEGDIVIRGHSRHDVASACGRLHVLAVKGRRLAEWTHLLCIPLKGVVTVVENFDTFRKAFLQSSGKMRGVDPSIFQNPLKLHLTLGTLKLLSQAEVDEAVHQLQESLPTMQAILGRPSARSPPVIRIQGVEYMNDDPAEVDILYAKVQLQDQSDRLQELADFLVDRLAAVGVLEKEYDRVKLHATVINTKLRRTPETPAGGSVAAAAAASSKSRPGKHHRHEPRETFDASRALKDFSNFDFGSVPLTELHLSQRYTAGDDQFYKPSHILNLL